MLTCAAALAPSQMEKMLVANLEWHLTLKRASAHVDQHHLLANVLASLMFGTQAPVCANVRIKDYARSATYSTLILASVKMKMGQLSAH